MKSIKDMFPELNILTRSPLIKYDKRNFCLDSLLLNESGEHIIKDNKFFYKYYEPLRSID
jgi:hypothetical protein